MGLTFNPFTGTLDFTGSGGGGGTIAGTIAATQVAFGTGVDTIGGSSDFTWNGTTAAFTSAHGLSFAGTEAPITFIGGDDGSGDTAVIIDNLIDEYVVLLFPHFTDILTSDTLELASDDFATKIDVSSARGIEITGPIGGGGGDVLVLKPSSDLSSFLGLYSFIHAGDTERNIIHTQQYARTDSGTNDFESGAYFGGLNAGGATVDIFGIGAEGHWTAGGVLSDYEFYLWDSVTNQAVFTINSTFPSSVQFGPGFSLSVPGTISATSGMRLGNGSGLATDTTTGHTGLIQAYDVNDATYRTFATLTNGNTPSFDLSAPAGGTLSGNFTSLSTATFLGVGITTPDVSELLHIRNNATAVTDAGSFLPKFIISGTGPRLVSLNTSFSTDVKDGLSFNQTTAGIGNITNGIGSLGTTELGLTFGMEYANRKFTMAPAGSTVGYEWRGAVAAGGTDRTDAQYFILGRSGTGATANYFAASTFFGAKDTSGNTATTYSIGSEGNWTNAGGFTVQRLFLFDQVANKTIFFTQASSGRVFFFGSNSSTEDFDVTVYGTVLALDPVTRTASHPLFSATQTWNSSGVTFTGILSNITDTASAAASKLLDLQVGSASKFSVTKAGLATTIGLTSTAAVDFSGSSSLLATTSAGYAPTANGSIGFDTTQKAWVTGGNGTISGRIGRVLSQLIGSSDTITASVVNNTETAFATPTFQIPASFIIAGKTVRITFRLSLTTSGSPPTLVLRLKYGSTVWNTPAITPAVNLAGQTCGYIIDTLGTAAAGASVNTISGPPSADPFSNINVLNGTAQPVALATNGAITPSVTAQWSTNTSGNSVTMLDIRYEEMN